jgi:hypothetical protein
MQPASAQDTMDAISAAVTPVVMISANAILISTISSKHQAMSDRMRDLTKEWRELGTGAARRSAIQDQLRLFDHRIAWIGRAHLLLYIATACFIAMVMVIALTPFLQTWGNVSVPLLISGVSLMLLAILLELLDLRKARASIDLERNDLKANS